FFFFSSRRRHTSFSRDWSSDVCSSDLGRAALRPVFHGSDMDRRAIDAAIANATAAGLAESISLRVVPVQQLASTFPALAATPAQIGRASCRERVQVAVGALYVRTKLQR